jgi:hypothetical protein
LSFDIISVFGIRISSFSVQILSSVSERLDAGPNREDEFLRYIDLDEFFTIRGCGCNYDSARIDDR